MIINIYNKEDHLRKQVTSEIREWGGVNRPKIVMSF